MLFNNVRAGMYRVLSGWNVYARKSSGIKHNQNNRVYELLWFCYLHTKRIKPETTWKIGLFKYSIIMILKCAHKLQNIDGNYILSWVNHHHSYVEDLK